MDLQRLNDAAKGDTCVLMAELDKDKQYVILAIRKVKTRDYGEKLVVDLEGKIFSYLPGRLSVDLLANNEEGLKRFQEQLTFSQVLMKRLQGRGRWQPVEFIIVSPDDHSNIVNTDNPDNTTGSSKDTEPTVADPIDATGPTKATEPPSLN